MAIAKGTVLLLGGSGFLGRLIGRHLTEQGYKINCVALESPADIISLGYPCRYWQWDGESHLPNDALCGETDDVSIILNFAGDPLGADGGHGRPRNKLIESRLRAAEVAADAAKRCMAATMIQASSVDFYGDRIGGEAIEATDVGMGFWPEAAARLERTAATLNPSTRLILLRLGEVFSLFGGPFRKRLLPYCYHYGAPLIDRNRYLNWIYEDDLSRMVQNIIENIGWQGPINATSPEACTLAELHDQFVKYYPPFVNIPIPRWAMRITRATEVEKSALNVKALPAKAEESGFRFRYPDIGSCLAQLLDRSVSDCFYYTRSQWLPASPTEVWNFFCYAKNWEKINPPSFRLKTRNSSAKVAKEGAIFDFDIHFFNLIPSLWRMRYTELVPGSSIKGLVQDGHMNMLELAQKFTPVAGGVRVDDIMRYQYPHSYYAIPFVRTISEHCNRVIFDYRQSAIQKEFTQQHSQTKKAS